MLHFKLFKVLFKKFKWVFGRLFFLTFLASYLTFLIRFNLRSNLSSCGDIRGKFHYVLGWVSLTSGTNNSVNWSKLLVILFFLYFPITIIIHFTLNYYQKYYERQVIVYLSKKFLSFAYKNKEEITSIKNEKTHLLTNSITNFSQQFFSLPCNLFAIFINIFLEGFSLYFLIKSRTLLEIIPLVIAFILANLLWFVLFNYLIRKIQKRSEEKMWEQQKEEKNQMKYFLENLEFVDSEKNLEKLYNLLEDNSRKLNFSFFISTFSRLPNFIIPGISIFFLFLVYNFWLGPTEHIDWNLYLVANACQIIFWQVGKFFHLSSSFSSFYANYRHIENFFKLGIGT